MLPQHRGPIWLVGPPGAGKTTVGRMLARRLGRSFVDLDAEIEGRARRRIATLFRTEGEAAFRRRESEALSAVAGRTGRAQVVACGGGVVASGANRRLLTRRGTVLWLDLPTATALARCTPQAGLRPLLANPNALRRRLARRRAHYRALGRRVDADAPLRIVLRRALAALRSRARAMPGS